jgi:hypothetical protein
MAEAGATVALTDSMPTNIREDRTILRRMRNTFDKIVTV